MEGLAALDVLLRTVDDADETKFKWVYAARKNVHGIRAVIHQVQFGEDPNRPFTHGVDMAGQLERFRVDQVNVGGRNGKDDTVRLGDVFGDEVACLLLDISRLVANGYL